MRYLPSILLFLSGCAAVPFKDIKAGDVDNLAYSVAQLIEYRADQPKWLEAETCIYRGYGNCKCKAAVSCFIINQWDGWACWYERPNPFHVRARFYDFSRGWIGYIDDNVFWE